MMVVGRGAIFLFFVLFVVVGFFIYDNNELTHESDSSFARANAISQPAEIPYESMMHYCNTEEASGMIYFSFFVL